MSNKKGRFGIHGGQYIPETLMNAVMELEEAYNHYKNDPQFQAELTELLNEYCLLYTSIIWMEMEILSAASGYRKTVVGNTWMKAVI